MFGTRAGRPKQKVYRALVQGDPISPKHQRPKSAGNLADRTDQLFFNDFFDFGDVVNWWLSDEHSWSRWRIQEIADTELRHGFRDSPSFGRTFEIYCGPTKLGTLEISASYSYDLDKNEIRASIELVWVRLLSWDTVVDFLHAIAIHIDSSNSFDSGLRIQAAMSRCLWDSFIIHDEDLGLEWGELTLTLQGFAKFYFDRKNSEAFNQMKFSANSTSLA